MQLGERRTLLLQRERRPRAPSVGRRPAEEGRGAGRASSFCLSSASRRRGGRSCLLRDRLGLPRREGASTPSHIVKLACRPGSRRLEARPPPSGRRIAHALRRGVRGQLHSSAEGMPARRPSASSSCISLNGFSRSATNDATGGVPAAPPPSHRRPSCQRRPSAPRKLEGAPRRWPRLPSPRRLARVPRPPPRRARDFACLRPVACWRAGRRLLGGRRPPAGGSGGGGLGGGLLEGVSFGRRLIARIPRCSSSRSSVPSPSSSNSSKSDWRSR